MFHCCFSNASLLLMCEWTVFCLEGTAVFHYCHTTSHVLVDSLLSRENLSVSLLPHYFSCVSGQSSVWRELQHFTTASLLLMCEWTVFCLEGTVECFTAASLLPHYYLCVSGQSSVWIDLLSFSPLPLCCLSVRGVFCLN